MAIITYEGFENYSSIPNVASFLNYEYTTLGGTINLISSPDANGITGRNSGTCLKLTNSLACNIAANSNDARPIYPRVFLKNPNNSTASSGVFGFAWYARLPSGGGWGSFTPIAALCDAAGKPHFYVGINSNLNIEIRSYNTGIVLAKWDTDQEYFGWIYSNITYWDIHYLSYLPPPTISYEINSCNGGSVATAFNTYIGGVGTSQQIIGLNTLPLLCSSNTLITMNSWNYIEVKFVLSTTTTGSIQVKINRNSSDNTLDANVSNIRTTYQNNTNSLGVALGQFWSHNSANTAALHTAGLWSMYYDDYYMLNLSGSNNDFLGRVSCKKFSYNTVSNYNMTTPSNSGTALNNFNETYSGAGSLSTINISNVTNQTLDVKSTGVSSETLSPIFVRQYVHGYKTDAASDIGIGASDGINNIAVSGVNFNNNSINGSLQFRDYDNAPDGSEWTNQKIADTTFKHTTISV